MNTDLPLITIKPCPKAWTSDLDKARTPKETIAMVKERVKASGLDICAGSERIDTGRLGIPVFLGKCGKAALSVMPTRKQMGKGSSPGQAEASALMELMERFAFFSFFASPPHAVQATWTRAEKIFGASLIPISQMLASVNDTLSEDTARELLDLREWLFYPATDLAAGKISWLPLDWFRMLGEFNGSSAGNTAEESLLQGISELVERHVCALIDDRRPELPTIDQSEIQDPALKALIAAFARNGINLLLKDFSLGMPLPTVGAIAWDPATFPGLSEIVFTAGTATSPEKAAIRAITEVAQLGGDFCTKSCYEASGLPKFATLEETAWLAKGPSTRFSSLPCASASDIADELHDILQKLAPTRVYAIETTSPSVGIPAHYCMAPGLQFRERDKNQSLGLFVGRKLAEEEDPEHARKGLSILAKACPGAHFLPFFEGLVCLREDRAEIAADHFIKSVPLQPDADSRALAAFYAGHALTARQKFGEAIEYLRLAVDSAPSMKEAHNLLGVACFKLKDYETAEKCFDQALLIDKGSAIDLANRGLARKFQGKKQAAREDLEAALRLTPDLDFAARHLAELLEED